MRPKPLLVALGTVLLTGGLAVLPQADAGASARRLPTHVNDCWSTDKVPPVIDSFEATPDTVDTTTGPATVQLTVAAHDVGGPGPASGVGRVQVVLTSEPPSTGTWFVGAQPQPNLTLGSDGLWHGSATIPQGVNSSYSARVIAWDKSGSGTRSPQGPSDSSWRDFDAFEVTSPTGPATDTAAPTLDDLTLSGTHVDTRTHARSVTVTATATDDDSGVRQVSIGLNPLSTALRDRSVSLHRVGTSDQYTGKLRFQRSIGDHRERLSVIIADNSRNVRRLLFNKLAARGFPSQIVVTSGPADRTGPRVVRVLQGARTVDLHHRGRWYPVRVVLADPQGVTSATARLSRVEVKTAQLHRVAGSALRGTWAGRLRVPRCLASPATVSLKISSTDGHGLLGGGFVRQVRLLSADHVAPSTKHIFWRVHEPVFRFTEPVHGISATTVDVYAHTASDSPQLLVGSWSCLGAKKQHVSCRKGSVLEATFTPDEADVIPDSVVWEPGLQLNVLDAHGNPFIGGADSPDVND